MRFSQLTQHFDVPRNRLYQRLDELKRAGRSVVDLVNGNPNALGIRFPPELLYAGLRQGLRLTRRYAPDPLGQKVARQAIAAWYRKDSLKISAEQILLTPGTSLSYAYAFQVLADRGDEILCPQPSYPLFDAIAAQTGITLTPYRLRRTHRWEIDFLSLEKAITPRTRAFTLISPHNPTGAVASAEEIERLVELAAHRNLPIIADEVFRPFLYTNTAFARPAACARAPLVITLNGFSKMLALPGMKIGWIAVSGRADLTRRFFAGAEMISDTFLPVNDIAQAAVPTLLTRSTSFQHHYVQRVADARRVLAKWKDSAIDLPEGGFFALARLPAGTDADQLALRLLNDGFLVHPGYFYDLDEPSLVFSFLQKPATLTRLRRSLQRATEPGKELSQR